MTGNTFPNMKHINGIRVMDRANHNTVKIELWMSVGLASH